MPRLLFSLLIFIMILGLCLCLVLGLTVAITSGGISETHVAFRMNIFLFIFELLLCFLAGYGIARTNRETRIRVTLLSAGISFFLGLLISFTCTIPSAKMVLFLRPLLFAFAVLLGGITEHFRIKHRKL